MNLFDTVVWVCFIGALIFVGFFFSKRMKATRELQKAAYKRKEEKKEMYSYLKPGTLDTCPREDVVTAVIFHCLQKEENNNEDYLLNFNDSEKLVYAIYMLSESLENGKGSIHNFFLNPSSRVFKDDIVGYFEKLHAFEIADLMKAARRFAEIIENDEDDDEDDPEMGDYSRYNFADFTHEFITLVSSTDLNSKIEEFILNHRNDFYDDNIPETDLEIEGEE